MKFDKQNLLLYAVTDRSWLGEKTLFQQVEEALQGGVTMLQLREKDLDEKSFMEEAAAVKALCARYQVPFLIDDNVSLALRCGADGVHVGQSDMEAGEVRARIGPDKTWAYPLRRFPKQFWRRKRARIISASARYSPHRQSWMQIPCLLKRCGRFAQQSKSRWWQLAGLMRQIYRSSPAVGSTVWR